MNIIELYGKCHNVTDTTIFKVYNSKEDEVNAVDSLVSGTVEELMESDYISINYAGCEFFIDEIENTAEVVFMYIN